MGAVGTPRKLVIDGVTYDCHADTDISLMPTQYAREGMPTTGRTLQKMTKRVKTMESIDIGATPTEVEALKEKSESLASKTLSIEFADGSVYKSSGQFHMDAWASADGKVPITLIPDEDWTPFLA